MKPRISVLTLGVDDLARAVAFYRDGLGWPTRGIVGSAEQHSAVAFFALQAGVQLALYPRASLALEAGVAEPPSGTSGCLLSHNVARREQVAEVMAQAAAAGARILRVPRDTAWGGHAGYFQDPDGHPWEVAWNPKWPVEDD